MKLDVLIRGGMVYDGLSDVGRMSDVGVLGGRIVLPPSGGDPAGSALFGPGVRPVRVIEAAGKAVLPGFIDIHSHSDLAWLVWPNATSKLLSGVTTDVSGNCGCSGFPLAGEVLARRRADYARHDLRIDWTDAAGYFARLEATPCGVNRAVLVGHGNLRGVTVGYANRPAGPDERAEMRRLLEDGLAAGAFGLSSGLIYPPGCFAGADELAELAAIARGHNGCYTSHIRNEGDSLLEAVDEFVEVLARSGCRGILSHVKTIGRANWPKISQLRDRLTAARQRGIDLWADRYPYTAACTGLSAMVLPRWAIEGTTDEVLARLADPAARRRIGQDERLWPADSRFFDDVWVTRFNRPDLARLAGKSLREVAGLRGQEPLDAALDLLIEDRLQTEAIHFCMSPDNLAEIFSWPFVMIGSDYSVRDALGPAEGCHPRAFGTPVAFLAQFVRDRAVCDWPTAARKLATMAADALGLADRGRIAPGCWADLVVLDVPALADRATYQNPWQAPAGIDCVLVNGTVAVDSGNFTGALAGKLLRRAS